MRSGCMCPCLSLRVLALTNQCLHFDTLIPPASLVFCTAGHHHANSHHLLNSDEDDEALTAMCSAAAAGRGGNGRRDILELGGSAGSGQGVSVHLVFLVLKCPLLFLCLFGFVCVCMAM